MIKQSQDTVKILLVDDEQDILEFFGYNLSKQGFQLSIASSGKEAIEIAAIEKPDLIVLDIMMPDTDGIETCQEIKANPECTECIILFLTAGSAQFARAAMRKAPADDFLLKPLRPKIFTTKIFSILQRFGKYSPRNNESFIIELQGLRLNRQTKECTTETRLLKLKDQEFEILWHLASQPGQVHSTQSLKKILLNKGYEQLKVKKSIIRIREKFGTEIIKTIKGLGYKLELEA